MSFVLPSKRTVRIPLVRTPAVQSSPVMVSQPEDWYAEHLEYVTLKLGFSPPYGGWKPMVSAFASVADALQTTGLLYMFPVNAYNGTVSALSAGICADMAKTWEAQLTKLRAFATWFGGNVKLDSVMSESPGYAAVATCLAAYAKAAETVCNQYTWLTEEETHMDAAELHRVLLRGSIRVVAYRELLEKPKADETLLTILQTYGEFNVWRFYNESCVK